jgi:hypothetical protein
VSSAKEKTEDQFNTPLTGFRKPEWTDRVTLREIPFLRRITQDRRDSASFLMESSSRCVLFLYLSPAAFLLLTASITTEWPEALSPLLHPMALLFHNPALRTTPVNFRYRHWSICTAGSILPNVR